MLYCSFDDLQLARCFGGGPLLVSHRGDVVKAEWIKKIVGEGVAMQKPNLWPRHDTGLSLDRRDYVTASEISRCARQVFFEKQAMRNGGYSPEKGTGKPQRGYGYFERGHTIEAWFVDNLTRGLRASVPLLYAGSNQRSFVRGYQSGTPDGAFMLTGERFKVLEVKSIDPRKKVSMLPQEGHVWQCTQNADLLEHALNRVCEGSILVYINASNYEEITPFEVPFDHALAERLEDRAKMIMEAVTPDQLYPEGAMNGSCDYCPFTRECSAVVRSQITAPTLDGIAEAAAKLFAR